MHGLLHKSLKPDWELKSAGDRNIGEQALLPNIEIDSVSSTSRVFFPQRRVELMAKTAGKAIRTMWIHAPTLCCKRRRRGLCARTRQHP